ncbi:lantibiotic dehydratase [Nocardia sp. NPDC003979]
MPSFGAALFDVRIDISYSRFAPDHKGFVVSTPLMSVDAVRPADPALVRVAGMPAHSLSMLRFDESRAEWDMLKSLDLQIRQSAMDIADELYEVIGSLDNGDPAKPALVGLRRAIHNDRRPTSNEWDAKDTSISNDLRRRITQWIASRGLRDEARVRFGTTLTEESRAKIDALRSTCADPGFRRGVAISSPALSNELEKWIATGKPLRTATVLRLTRYLSRATAKTSLFSSLGVVGTVAWISPNRSQRGKHSEAIEFVSDLDALVSESIVSWVAGDSDFKRLLPVRVNPSLYLSDDNLHYLNYDRLTGIEVFASIKASPSIVSCLEIFSKAGSKSADEMCRLLALPGSSEWDRVTRYVGKLVEIGILEACAPIPDTAHEPVAALSAWLDDELGGHAVADTVRRLKELLVQRVSLANVEAQILRLSQLKCELTHLTSILGSDDGGLDGASTEAARMAHFPFHETGLLLDPVLIPSAPIEDTVLADLDRADRMMSVFDTAVVVKAAVAGFYAEQYQDDEQVPLLEFYRAVCSSGQGFGASGALADVSLASKAPTQQHWIDIIGQDPVFHREETRKLRTYWAQVTELLSTAPTRGGEVTLSPDEIDRVTLGWPQWINERTSMTYYVQSVGGPSDGLVVLNEAHSGFGRNRSRIHHLLDRAGAATTALSPAQIGDEAVVAEFMGTFRGATNRRTAVAEFEIEYPRVVTSRRNREVLRLADLVVRRDSSTDRVELWSVSLNKRVVPVHNGMMAPFLLPGLVAWTTWLFGPSRFLRPSAFTTLRRQISGVEPERRIPRVRVGSVVLFRAATILPVSEIPRQRSGESDAVFLDRFWTWASVSGLPERTFARPAGTTTDMSLPGIFPKDRKPLYLDLRNVLSVLDFTRHLRADGEVLFEEALPDPLEIDAGDEHAHVSELVFEVNPDGARV